MRRALLCGQPRDKRHRPLAHDDRLAGDAARHGCLRQNELRLTGADQLDIDLRQQFGVEQRAMLGAAGIVDRVARAQIVEPVRSAGMLAPREQQRVDQALAR